MSRVHIQVGNEINRLKNNPYCERNDKLSKRQRIIKEFIHFKNYNLQGQVPKYVYN